jgi:hypothetical protein
VFPGVPTEADRADLAAAARPLLDLLADRGLLADLGPLADRGLLNPDDGSPS